MDINQISELSATGVYTLILNAKKENTITIGKLGDNTFSEGYYTYTGSSLGIGATNLKNRIARHQKKQKHNFWHIDYFLADKNVTIETVVGAETTKKIECPTNNYLMNLRGTKVPVKRFGASDCRKNCKSHLLYFPNLKETKYLVQKLLSFFNSSTDILSIIIVD